MDAVADTKKCVWIPCHCSLLRMQRRIEEKARRYPHIPANHPEVLVTVP